MKKNLLMASVLCVSAYAVQDGTLDPLFGTDGQVLQGTNVNGFRINLRFKPDGSLLFPFQNNVSDLSAVMHLNPDGTLDPNFTMNFVDQAPCRIVLQPDNKIVMSGPSGTNIALVRYNTDGSLDTTFGNLGRVILPFEFFANNIALQKDGKIVIVGTYNGSVTLARFTINGTLDSTFGGTGLVHDLQASELISLAIDRQGRIITVGSSGGFFYVARYLTNGSLDSSFGISKGYTISSIIGALSEVALQADGKIIAGGTGDILRYLPEGIIDISFGDKGNFVIPIAGSPNVWGIQVQTDGKIIFSLETNNNFSELRLTSQGKLDTSFGQGGIVSQEVLATQSVSYFDSINATGAIAVVGSAINSQVALMQLQVPSLKYSPLSQAIWKRYYNQNI